MVHRLIILVSLWFASIAHAGALWFADAQSIQGIDTDTNVVSRTIPQPGVVALTLDQKDGSLWVLGRNTLSRYSAQGALLGSASLSGGMQQAAFLALDDANAALWLGGSKSLFQIAPSLPVQAMLTITTSEVISMLSLDAGTGNLWVAGQSSLFGFTKDGANFVTADLAPQKLGNFLALDFDAQSQSLWLGHEKGISRFDTSGQLGVTLDANVKVNAISAAPSGIVPLVALAAPANGTLTRNAFIPIRVHYDASCFGQPCGFPSSVFAAYVLTATLDGQSIGGSFVFDPATNDAIFTPTTRWSEGAHAFTAFVTDSSGRRSRTITAQFTVDTLAPRFVNVSPADGSTFTSPNITLPGNIDDASGRVGLESFGAATISGANPQGQFFTWGIE